MHVINFCYLMRMRILFVCTANMCRSVMAVAAMTHELSAYGKDFEVESAGVDAISNLKADKSTVQVCLIHGLDVSSHRSRQVTKEMLDQSDVVLCLAEDHKRLILSAYPKLHSKVFLLKQYSRNVSGEELSVTDPIGRPFDHYERCFRTIEEEVKRIASLLIREEK
jgi:ribose 5-phosphate isomerase B